MVWTLSELRPLDPSVCTLMWSGTLRSIFSRIHCTDRHEIHCTSPALIHSLMYNQLQQDEILYTVAMDTLVHAELMTDL